MRKAIGTPGMGASVGEGSGLAGMAPGVGIGGVAAGSTRSEQAAASTATVIATNVRTDLSAIPRFGSMPTGKVYVHGGDSGSAGPLLRGNARPHDG